LVVGAGAGSGPIIDVVSPAVLSTEVVSSTWVSMGAAAVVMGVLAISGADAARGKIKLRICGGQARPIYKQLFQKKLNKNHIFLKNVFVQLFLKKLFENLPAASAGPNMSTTSQDG